MIEWGRTWAWGVIVGSLLPALGAAYDPFLPYPPMQVGRFNSEGTIKFDITSDENGARQGIWTSDNKMLVVGWGSNGSESDYVLTRFWPDGSPDVGFDTDGVVITNFGADSLIHDVVEDGSGNYITVGRSNENMVISKYRTDGSLDPTFGTLGHQTIDFGPGNADSGKGIDIDSTGRIIAVGFTNTGTGWDFAIARLTPAGVPDVTFNTTGQLITGCPDGHDDRLDDVWVDANDKIWAVGKCNSDDADGVDEDMAMIRIATDGSIDTLVMTDSPGSAPANSNERAWGIAGDASGRAFSVGRVFNSSASEWELVMLRYTAAGALDSIFTRNVGSGIIGRSVSVNDLEGRVYISGKINDGTDWNTMIAKITTAGQVDGTFAATGVTNEDVSAEDESAIGLIEKDEKLIVVGWSSNGGNKDFTIVRFNADGSKIQNAGHDAHFNGGGEVLTDFQLDADRGFALSCDSRRHCAVVGYTENGANTTRDFGIMQWTSAGDADVSFSGDGQVISAINGADQDQARAAAHDSSDRLIVAGFTENGGGNTRDSVVQRYNTDGTPDAGFATGGTLNTDLAAGDRDEIRAVMVDNQDRILAAGVFESGNAASREMMVVRILTDGTLDTAFSGDGIAVTNFAGETWAYAISTDSQGRILVAGLSEVGGNTNADRDFAVARFLSTGVLDNTFSTDGMHTRDYAGERDEAFAVREDFQNRIVVAGFGESGAQRDAVTMRFLSDGSNDNAWDTDGLQFFDRAAAEQRGFALGFQSNNKIIVSGEDANNVMILRYLTNGSLDTSFDGSGALRENVSGNDEFFGLHIFEDDRMITGGRCGNDLCMLRVWP